MATNAKATSQSFHLNIVNHLQTLPLVNSALDIANQSYAKIKSFNPLVNATLDRAEKSLNFVASSAIPVLSQLQQPINYADSIACQGFEKLQKSVPAINKSPEEIKSYTCKYYDQTKERLSEVKQQAIEKVHSVLGMSDSIVNSLDTTLNAADSALEYLLPRQSTEDESKSASAENGSADDDIKSSALIKLIHRMGKLSDKIRRRVVDYTRYKWLPAIFGSVVVLKSKAVSLNGALKPTNAIAVTNGSSSPNGGTNH